MSMHFLCKDFYLLLGTRRSRTAIYEITLVRLPVCPSVRLSVCPSVRLFVRPALNFLKIESLVFFDIVHDDS